VFAILEKTKVLGTDTFEGVTYTKKNLNAMVAFVIGFLVLASSRLVEIVTQVSSQMVILLLLSIFFLLLVGSFWAEADEPFHLNNRWKVIFTLIMFVGIIGIFLMAIKTENGTPWLEWFWYYVIRNASGTIVASILLMIIVIGLMAFIVYDPTNTNKRKKST
jgi:hypothetical membrane protein